MKPTRLPRLGDQPGAPFPPPELALSIPNGLLAFGGDLSPARLLNAYRQGIFPWYDDSRPILWWCPDPRTVFFSDQVHLSRRARRRLRGSGWRLRADTRFAETIDACARAPRRGQQGTWITPELREAFLDLHRLGHAHSIEVFRGGHQIGGLYGLAIGRMFFAESMYSAETDASKAALTGLAALLNERGWPLIDAQVENPHLSRLGARSMPRTAFLNRIDELCAQPETAGSWADSVGERALSELIA